jgi:hypothetical protein
MTNMDNTTHPTRIREAERLGEKLLPGMPFEDRLKVAEVVLSNYGRVAQTYPVDHERVRTDISRELRMLANGGERWAGQALLVYVCKVCFDSRAEMYEPVGHRAVCGVTSLHEPVQGLMYHRAARVQYYGGSWDLNVYIAECGITNLVNGSRGLVPCPECFR